MSRALFPDPLRACLQAGSAYKEGDVVQARVLEKKTDERGRRKTALTQLAPGEVSIRSGRTGSSPEHPLSQQVRAACRACACLGWWVEGNM